jgi:MFS family permease
LTKFREILKNKNFYFLCLGQVISQFGDRLNQMALVALISVRAPGSTFQLAKVLSFTIIPVFLVGPIAASYVDRWNRRRTMIFCDLLRAGLVAFIALFFIKFGSIWPLYIIIFLVFSVSRFFVPAKMAIIPELVSQDKLLLANSLSSTTGTIAVIAGFGLGGLIVEQLGTSGSFLIDAITYLISGLFIFMIATRMSSYLKQKSPLPRVLDVKRILRRTLFADIKEGWQYLAQDKDMRFIAQMFFLLGSAIGAISVVIIVFVQKNLGSITQDLGLLAMFLGVGLFSGSLIYGRFGQFFSRIKIIFFAFGVSGITLSLFTVSLHFLASTLAATCLSFILGLSLSPIIISAQTLIHEGADENMRGRIFGSLEIIAHLAFLLFMFLSSFLAEKIGRFWILLSVSVILMIIGFGALGLQVNSNRRRI